MAAVPIINEERGPDYTTGKYKQQDLGPSLQSRYRDYAEENPAVGLLGMAVGPGKYLKGGKILLGLLASIGAWEGGTRAVQALWPKSDEEKYQQKLYDIDQQQSKQDSLFNVQQINEIDSKYNSLKNRFQ